MNASRRYREAVAELQARGRFGIRLGLGRTRAILRTLGDPQLACRGVLIAGTNGKGSVQALVGAALRAAGYRVGQTPKPHLVEYRERILIDGHPLGEDEFAGVVEATLDAAGRVPRRMGPPTEFELLTAASFLTFARLGVHLAVVEVGLGGRLDATNAWDGGVAVVTNVDYDHMDRLGPTLEAIAREKAAIVKRGDRAVTGAVGAPLAVIRRRSRRLRVPLVEAAPLDVLGHDREGLRVAAAGLGEVYIGLLGRHQAANAAVALACLDTLDAAGIASTPAGARRAGLADARWPGRLELVPLGGSVVGLGIPPAPDADRPSASDADLLLDGAHNEGGMVALLAALAELRPDLAPGRITLVVGIMGDKDVAAIVGRCAAAPVLRGARIIATHVEGDRAMRAGALAAAWQLRDPQAEVIALTPVRAALDEALGITRRNGGLVVVAGSLYLVGEVRALLAARGLVRADEDGA
jgi:dihydrofolate synthase / folylpolyglutamate synthase